MDEDQKGKEDVLYYWKIWLVQDVQVTKELASKKEPDSVVAPAMPKWPTEVERISQGEDPYRGSAQSIIHNQQEETTTARKPPIKFTEFYIPPRVWLARKWATAKGYIGTSAVGGVTAALLIPGPHAIVLCGGLVLGVAAKVVIEKIKK